MFTSYSTALRKVLLKSRACFVRRSGSDADRVQLLRRWEGRRGHMGKRSDRRKFRRRRRWGAFFLLLSLALMAFPWQDNANTYIAAHRLGWPGTASDHQFYNLPLLAEGDVIYLGDVNGTTYTYEVTGFKEITPDETWVTTPQPGRDMVSLQTCIETFGDYWTMGPNWYVRYIVQADRVSVDVAK